MTPLSASRTVRAGMPQLSPEDAHSLWRCWDRSEGGRTEAESRDRCLSACYDDVRSFASPSNIDPRARILHRLKRRRAWRAAQRKGGNYLTPYAQSELFS